MNLSMTGMGLVCAVGMAVENACAAIRAGVSRAAPLPDQFTLGNIEEGGEEEPITAHGVTLLTDGYFMIGRWTRLARAAIRDLTRNAGAPDDDSRLWDGAGVVLLVPEAQDRYSTVDSLNVDELAIHYLDPLLEACEIRIPESARRIVVGDHVGGCAALQQAEQMLSTSNLKKVLIVAADSYLEPGSVNWLAAHQRLKTPENPAGLQPGEAGAAILVEPAESRDPLLRFLSLTVGEEVGSFFDEESVLGEGMATTVGSALAAVDGGQPFAGDWIADLNGENWKAYQLGFARVRLGPSLLSEQVRFMLPVASTGETGCVQLLIGLCMAAGSYARAYASGQRTLITCSSEYGHVGACVVSPK